MPDTKRIQWKLSLGALAATIEDQLSAQGLVVPHVELYQKSAEAIVLLSVRGVLAESETRRARRRLVKQIGEKLLRVE